MSSSCPQVGGRSREVVRPPCLNVFAHPEKPEGCSEGCAMCCGYTTPAVCGMLIVMLTLASDAYSVYLIVRYPHDAWRIVVSLIILLVTTGTGALGLWSLYAVVFTSPGLVPRDPWEAPPVYAGPPPLPSFPLAAGYAAPPVQHSAFNNLPALPPPHEQGSATLPPPAVTVSSQTGRPTEVPPTPPPFRNEAAQPPSQPSGLCAPQNANPLEDLDRSSKGLAGTAILGSERGGRSDAQPVSHAALPPPCAGPDDADFTGLEVGLARPSHSPYHPMSGPARQQGIHEMPLPPLTAPPISIPVQSPNHYRVKELDRNGCLRFCYRCRLYKPDFSHHCSLCGRCVYNFDHHCPFINNCVGRNNYKLFLLFLLYLGVGGLLEGGLMLILIFAVDGADLTTKAWWIIVPALDIVLGISLLLFHVQHRILLRNGQSTLEHLTGGSGRNALEAFRRTFQRNRLTPEQKVAMAQQRKAKVELHNLTLLGQESPWWRRWLPLPVRTDDSADDTVADGARDVT